MEDVGLVRAWNCVVVVLNFDPLNLIGSMFDCCLIPIVCQLRAPVKMNCVHFPLIVAVPPIDSIDLTSSAVASMNLTAIMDFEQSTVDFVVAANMDKAFEMIYHHYYSRHYYYPHLSRDPYLAFDFW